MTRKLYYEDVYLDVFEALVLVAGVKDSRPYAVLDATCFYPEGGGQACDTGTLSGIRVLDVQEEEGELRHYLESPITEKNQVQGKIEWEGRFHRMQQHLGEHILAAVIKSRFNGNTFGVHFGHELNTLDFDVPLSEDNIKAAEAEVNNIIYKNTAVKTYFPDIGEVREKSRKAVPVSDEPIRVVEIAGVDYIACCGTHPYSTGEVGLVKIFKAEAYKGGTRVFFSCGMAALNRLGRVWDDAAQMQRMLSAGDFELPARLRRLIEDNKELSREKQSLTGRLMALEAKRLYSSSVLLGDNRLIAGCAEVSDAGELKSLFAILSKEPATILLGGILPKGGMLIFGSHKEAARPGIRDIFREALDLIGGKGGGSDAFSQGTSLSATSESIETVIINAKNRLLKL